MEDVSGRKLSLICQIVIASVLATAALIYMRSVLLPLVISLFIVVVASPVIQFGQRNMKLPRSMVIILGIALSVVTTSLFWLVVYFSVESFATGVDAYQEKTLVVVGDVSQWLAQVGVSMEQIDLKEALRSLPIFSVLKTITKAFATLLGDSFIVFIIVLFLLFGQSGKEGKGNGVVLAISNRVQKYVGAKVLTSFATSFLVGGVLVMVGLDLAAMFALLTFFLNFIPSVGSIVAVILPLPIAFLQFGFGWTFVTVLVLPLIFQFVIGNIIEPKMMGESIGLHPVTLIVALLFWGKIWGVPGMFLAVPITAIVQIICDRIDILKPVANILAGRW